VVNSQVNYIISAVLMLVIAAGIVKFIKLVPAGIVKEPANIGWCGTESSSTQIPLSDLATKGKALFMGKCASCHALFKNLTGPGLIGFTERGPWVERKNVYAWIRNPSAFMQTNKYTSNLKAMYGSMMTAFPDLTDEEVDAICEYIQYSAATKYITVVLK
jgi:cytochrome c2